MSATPIGDAGKAVVRAAAHFRAGGIDSLETGIAMATNSLDRDQLVGVIKYLAATIAEVVIISRANTQETP